MLGRKEDSHWRVSEGVIMQGANPLYRSMTYYEVGQQAAYSANKLFAWIVQRVPSASHDFAGIFAPAARRLFTT